MDLSQRLVNWYRDKKRDLPWRGTKDPYKIWVSEIILQQTRVLQGTEYYLRFIQEYPDIPHLAEADLDQVMKVWQGLGYYSRARNLHEAARYLHSNLNSRLPTSYNELLKIKGIGEYTAAAIASFAYGEPVPLVDGNVFRVLSRLFMIPHPKGTTHANRRSRDIAKNILDPENPGLHNEAIMEFGAIHCTPTKPDCTSCVLNQDCKAFVKNKVQEYPKPVKKPALKSRYINYLVILYNGKVLIKKRSGKDIWNGLYDFPSIETTAKQSAKKVVNSKEWSAFFAGAKMALHTFTNSYIHLLSHQKIYARFYITNVENPDPRYLEKFILVRKWWARSLTRSRKSSLFSAVK